MKFNIKSEGKHYIVNAKSELEAVKKLKDSKKRKLNDSWIGKNVSTQLGTGSVIDYKELPNKRIWSVKLDRSGDIVNTSCIKFNGFEYDSAIEDKISNSDVLKVVKKYAPDYSDHLGRGMYVVTKAQASNIISELGNKVRREDYGGDFSVICARDAAVNDSASYPVTLDPKHAAEYGWTLSDVDKTISNIFWAAAEVNAKKFTDINQFAKAVATTGKEMYEDFAKASLIEFNKLIAEGRSKINTFESNAKKNIGNVLKEDK